VKLPRNVSGRALGKALSVLGYGLVRQVGSHLQYATNDKGYLKVTIPDHTPVKPGTLSKILPRIASHHELTRDELLLLLFN